MRRAFFVLLLTACGPSMVELRGLSEAKKLQENAPIQGSAYATIAAPIGLVWSVFADVAGWPKWNDEAAAAEIAGPFVAGTEFAYGAPSRHHLVLGAVEPQHSVSWYGTLAGYKGVTLWDFEATPEGSTKVVARESNDGFLITNFYSQNELELHLTVWVDLLKHEAERRAASNTPQ